MFEARGDGQQFCVAVERDDIRYRRRAVGERTGLVEGDDLDRPEMPRCATLDKDAALAGGADASGHGHGVGHDERTGAAATSSTTARSDHSSHDRS